MEALGLPAAGHGPARTLALAFYKKAFRVNMGEARCDGDQGKHRHSREIGAPMKKLKHAPGIPSLRSQPKNQL